MVKEAITARIEFLYAELNNAIISISPLISSSTLKTSLTSPFLILELCKRLTLLAIV